MTKNAQLLQEISESKTIQSNLQTLDAQRAMELTKSNILLTERNLFVETLLDASPDLIMVVDRDLRFLTVNKLAELVFSRFNPGSIIGKKLLEVAPFTEKEPAYLHILAAFKSKKANVFSGKSSVSDNYYESSCTPLKNLEGEIYAVMIISHDTTAQVKSEQQIRELNTSFNYAEQIGMVGSFSFNFKTRALLFSDNLYRLLGCAPQSFKATIDDFLTFVHPEDVDLTKQIAEQIFGEKKAAVWEYRLRRKDGQIIHARSTAEYFTDENQLEWLVGTLQDITEATALEIAKQKMTDAKNEAESKRQVAENMVKAKQQFLSNMSHEIRTPMNAIVGFTNVILKTELDEKQTQYVHAIKTSGDALIVLINDILDLAKVDAGKMTFEHTAFNLCAAVAAMTQLFEEKIKEKNLVLTTEFDPNIPQFVVGDPMRLRQVILNLMSNAVKFTANGHVAIRVKLLQTNAEQVTIKFSISDSGIGIAAEKIGEIFHNFEQVHAEGSSKFGGTGLGLAIVKQLVERQGGRIYVESTLGVGSLFNFELPFDQPKTNPIAAGETPFERQKMPRDLKILVAEDVELNQLLIKIILADFGFEVDLAKNGQIALDFLAKNHYDLILMDLQMPEMNGFEATTHIRNVLKNNIPIIALTADVTNLDVEKSQAVGMDDYISKPIDEQLLYEKIIRQFQKQG